MREKISVIIPVYNVEAYLNRCVQSIVEQTHQNLQIILVDDGSPDGSPAMCDEWAGKDDRIQVIHQKNSGLSGARNAGLAVADGEYVVFVDSDDYIKNTMLADLLELCNRHQAEVAVCGYTRFSGERLTDEELKASGPTETTVRVYGQVEAMRQLHGWYGELYTVAWNKLYKRSLWQGITYPVGKINEDEFTTYKLLYRATNVVITNQIYYYYFYNSNSITTNEKYLGNLDVFQAFAERKQMFMKDGQTELAGIVEKAMLDRIVIRYRKAKQANKTEVMNQLKLYYKQQYKNLSVLKPGVGYRIFYFSPGMYEMLLRIKRR